MALIVLIPACATQTDNVASSHVEAVLVQSGFKVRTAKTPSNGNDSNAYPIINSLL
jgi:hypothetical protein